MLLYCTENKHDCEFFEYEKQVLKKSDFSYLLLFKSLILGFNIIKVGSSILEALSLME